MIDQHLILLFSPFDSLTDHKWIGLNKRSVPESLLDSKHQADETAQSGACYQIAGGEQCTECEASHQAGWEECSTQGWVGTSSADGVS